MDSQMVSSLGNGQMADSNLPSRRTATLKLIGLCFIPVLLLMALVFVFYVLLKLSVPWAASLSPITLGVLAIICRFIWKQLSPDVIKKIRAWTGSFLNPLWRSANRLFVVGAGFGMAVFSILLVFLLLHLVFDPYTGRGQLVLSDDLQHYNSHHYNWDIKEGVGTGGCQSNNNRSTCPATAGTEPAGTIEAGCQLSSNGYQVTDNQPNTIFPCIATLPQYLNFVYEVHMTITSGGDCGGLVFRDQPNVSKMYLLRICSDGSYRLLLYKSGPEYDKFDAACAQKGQSSTPGCIVIDGKYSQPSQSYRLAIVANGSTFTVYVNGDSLQSQDDTNIATEGHIGVVAVAHDHPTTVTFTNAKLWKL